jgi:hypothetical protein
MATRIGVRRSRNKGSIPGRKQRFLFSIKFRPIQWLQKAVSPGLKLKGLEDGH